MLYSCTKMVTVGVKGLILLLLTYVVKNIQLKQNEIIRRLKTMQLKLKFLFRPKERLYVNGYYVALHWGCIKCCTRSVCPSVCPSVRLFSKLKAVDTSGEKRIITVLFSVQIIPQGDG